jgi:hypothetical protein
MNERCCSAIFQLLPEQPDGCLQQSLPPYFVAPESVWSLPTGSLRDEAHTIRLFGKTASGGFIGTIGTQHLVIPLDPSGKTLLGRHDSAVAIR